MNKKLIIGIGVLAVGIVALTVALKRNPHFLAPIGIGAPDPVVRPEADGGSYLIDGKTVALARGEADVQVETGIFVKYKYVVQADGLLNEDVIVDSGVILAADPGGSGTFYYATAFVSSPDGTWQGTNGILLGDRITLGIVDVDRDHFIVNYLDRKPDEPFSTPPSVEVTKSFQVRNGVLVEVK